MSEQKPALDRRLVESLERDLERAIAGVVERFGEELPVGPDRATMHLMAKAAVTVLEAAALPRFHHGAERGE